MAKRLDLSKNIFAEDDTEGIGGVTFIAPKSKDVGSKPHGQLRSKSQTLKPAVSNQPTAKTASKDYSHPIVGVKAGTLSRAASVRGVTTDVALDNNEERKDRIELLTRLNNLRSDIEGVERKIVVANQEADMFEKLTRQMADLDALLVPNGAKTGKLLSEVVALAMALTGDQVKFRPAPATPVGASGKNRGGKGLGGKGGKGGKGGGGKRGGGKTGGAQGQDGSDEDEGEDESPSVKGTGGKGRGKGKGKGQGRQVQSGSDADSHESSESARPSVGSKGPYKHGHPSIGGKGIRQSTVDMTSEPAADEDEGSDWLPDDEEGSDEQSEKEAPASNIVDETSKRRAVSDGDASTTGQKRRKTEPEIPDSQDDDGELEF